MNPSTIRELIDANLIRAISVCACQLLKVLSICLYNVIICIAKCFRCIKGVTIPWDIECDKFLPLFKIKYDRKFDGEFSP